MSVQTSYINELNCSCFCDIINILLTELSRSVWENLDLGRMYRPHCVRSVLTTSVKILPYRPPARLIRAKYDKKETTKILSSPIPGKILPGNGAMSVANSSYRPTQLLNVCCSRLPALGWPVVFLVFLTVLWYRGLSVCFRCSTSVLMCQRTWRRWRMRSTQQWQTWKMSCHSWYLMDRYRPGSTRTTK